MLDVMVARPLWKVDDKDNSNEAGLIMAAKSIEISTQVSMDNLKIFQFSIEDLGEVKLVLSEKVKVCLSLVHFP